MKINGGQPVLIRHFSENLPIDYLTISNLWKIIFWLNLQWSRCVAESVGEMAKSPTHRPHSAHTVTYPLKNRPHIAHTIKNAHTPPTPSTCGKKQNILGKNVFGIIWTSYSGRGTCGMYGMDIQRNIFQNHKVPVSLQWFPIDKF